MTLEVQFKIKSNPLYIKFLHENSHWYKILNRDPDMFNNFVEEVKTNYKLRTSDKINKALSELKLSGIRVDNTLEFYREILKESKPYKSYISFPDGHGNLAIIFSRIRPDKTLQFLALPSQSYESYLHIDSLRLPVRHLLHISSVFQLYVFPVPTLKDVLLPAKEYHK